MKTIILFIALLLFALGAYARPSGSITNIQVAQGTGENERLVSIQFDLAGSDASYNLALEVSFNNGATYSPVNPAEITGSLNVAPGNGIQLVWDGRMTYGTVYAEMTRIRITATPVATGCTFTDIRDGNTYRCVTIGDQVWMAENLRYLPEPDPSKISGTSLTLVGPGTGSENDPYAYVYGYDGTDVTAAKATANYQNYGVLYNWPAAMGYEDLAKNDNVQGVCPAGWYLPSDADWTKLVNYVVAQGYPNSNVVGGAGNALKSCRQVNSPSGGECNTLDHPRWDSHETHYGTDKFGYSALPGGYRWTNGNFYDLGGYSIWWVATEESPTNAKARNVDYNIGYVGLGDSNKAVGFSVRCVRDVD